MIFYILAKMQKKKYKGISAILIFTQPSRQKNSRFIKRRNGAEKTMDD